MAEHLTPSGRAGIIVPEGIIFQSQNAHKQLRKMLVEEYLVAVVSLPAGVFNPYSGVKTSILILDKALAKRTDRIAFFKVENDGFDLGAQRRPIYQNDLPRTEEALREYLDNVGNMDGQDGQDKGEPPPSPDESVLEQLIQQGTALIVEKSKIADSGEYNLSGERYKESTWRKSQFPMVPLGDVADVIAGQSPPGKSYNNVGVGTPFYQGKAEFGRMYIGEPAKWTTDPQRLAEEGDILMSVRAPVGPVNFATQKICIGRGLAAIRPISDRALGTYIFRLLRSLESEITGSAGAAFASINKGAIKKIEVPLPPLATQREIVAEVQGYQRVIDGARAVIDNYKPHIPIDPDWPMVELGEVVDVRGGKRLPKGHQFTESPTDHPYIRVCDFRDRSVKLDDLRFISEEVHSQIARYTISSADVYISIAGTIGLMGTIPGKLDGANLTENAARLSFDQERLDRRFLAIVGSGELVQDQIRSLTHAVGVPKLALERIRTLRLPVPPIDRQQTIVAEIEAEQAVVDANRELIERFKEKISAAIGRVWGDGEVGRNRSRRCGSQEGIERSAGAGCRIL